MQDDSWRVWNRLPDYGEVLFQRAIGLTPEMESSKATAQNLDGIIFPECRVLDVGCGAGHYLRSLRNQFEFPFSYVGVDSTPYYIELAKKAFVDDKDASFQLGDIYHLPFEPQSFDIVISCNLFLHLPSIVAPLNQLWQVTKRFMLIRTLIGKSSFRIKQVREWSGTWDRDSVLMEQDPIFDETGEPRDYHYFNIYSIDYISYLCSNLPGISKSQIVPDSDYDPAALGTNKWPGKAQPGDLTEMVAGWQVNGYILQPWAFIKVWGAGA